MTIRREILVSFFGVSAFALVHVATPAAAQGTPEQQQLCTDDAFRLCGNAIPDVERVTACMIARQSQLSPGCKSVFRPAGVAPVAEREPLEIAPRRAAKSKAKPAKAAKAKKKPRRE